MEETVMFDSDEEYEGCDCATLAFDGRLPAAADADGGGEMDDAGGGSLEEGRRGGIDGVVDILHERLERGEE